MTISHLFILNISPPQTERAEAQHGTQTSYQGELRGLLSEEGGPPPDQDDAHHLPLFSGENHHMQLSS